MREEREAKARVSGGPSLRPIDCAWRIGGRRTSSALVENERYEHRIPEEQLQRRRLGPSGLLPEIAFMGRANVVSRALINSARSKGLARTSSTPVELSRLIFFDQ